LGLPLAYSLVEEIVEATPIATKFVDETFELLLAGLDLDDSGFESLDEILGLAEQNK